MTSMMKILLMVVLFTALIGTIAGQVVNSTNDSNITGAANTLLGLITLIVVIVFVAVLARIRKIGF